MKNGRCIPGPVSKSIVTDPFKIELGFRADARPFSYKDESGKAAGYSIALCEKIADDVKTELGLPSLTVDWVPVTLEGLERIARHVTRHGDRET